MSQHSSAVPVQFQNPGMLKLTSLTKILPPLLAVIGAVTFFCALKTDATRAWSAYLINFFFFFCLALGGIFFASVHWITSAMWSTPIRRIAEAFSSYLPYALLLFLGLFWGMHDLYHWTHTSVVEADPILKGKSSYLNTSFFFIRNTVMILAWIGISGIMIRRSLAQDQDRKVSHTEKNKMLSPIFIILFGVGFTMMSFDLLMSLDPHWFSTIYGVYCFAGLFYSTLCSLCLMTIWLRKKGYLLDFVNDNHLHDLGKFMFAFTIFYAYIGFSQFMLIWYANLPEETIYFIKRMAPGWMPVFLFLLFGKFAFPFLALLPRGSKRTVKILAPMAVYMLVAHWIDVLFLVQPEFFSEGPRVGWTEIGIFLGFLGVFFFAVFRFLSKHNVIAIGDPRLSESVLHHHQ